MRWSCVPSKNSDPVAPVAPVEPVVPTVPVVEKKKVCLDCGSSCKPSSCCVPLAPSKPACLCLPFSWWKPSVSEPLVLRSTAPEVSAPDVALAQEPAAVSQ